MAAVLSVLAESGYATLTTAAVGVEKRAVTGSAVKQIIAEKPTDFDIGSVESSFLHTTTRWGASAF